MKLKGLKMICMTALLAGCNSAVDMEQQIDEFYAKMPQEERIAQLKSMYMDELFNDEGQLDTTKCRELIPYGIGHFSQFALQKPRDPNTIRDMVVVVQDWLKNNTPNGIPALFHEEVLSGINTKGSTIYPQQIGQACSFNTELAELKTRQTSTTMRKMGGILALSPMVDVCRTPSFNRLEESYGEDAYLSAAMGVAFVKGLQQGNLKTGVGACTKHYLGYGGGGDAEEKELMEEILLPHETMIRTTGSVAVMPGYHDVHGTRCVCNSEILQDILRGYVGFDGMVVSDYTAIDQIPGLETTVQKAAAAINNGNDVDFPFGANYQYLQQAIDEGLVKPETLERAVKNVLRVKFRAGLFDSDAYLYSTDPITLDTPEERQTAYDIATQSVVLLENNGILPLVRGYGGTGARGYENTSTSDTSRTTAPTHHRTPETKTVLLTGPNANSMWAMLGDYSFPAMSYFWKKVENDLDHPHIITLLEGMKASKPEGVNLMYSRGCDWTEEIETKFSELGDERAWEYDILHRKVDSGEKADKAEALAMAKDADVIIAAVGENVMLCGENRDRQGLRLPGKQEQYVEELIKTGKPVVLVVFGGRAQVISGIAEKCAAVIQAWYPGEEGGNAVADILYGNVSPSAKLSVSYPNTELYEPICYNSLETSTSDKSPSCVPSVASDQRSSASLILYPSSKIQWPFGYGLTYTTFEYANLQVNSEAQTSDDFVELTFQVKNTGNVAATEIAQIYLSPTDSTHSSNIRPIQLQGFARIALEPGQTKTVTTRVYVEQLGFYSHNGSVRQWNIEPGTYTFKVGASSADIRLKQQLILRGSSVTKPLRDHYFSESTVSL